MNNLQRIILVLTVIVFAIVCFTVPKQEYQVLYDGRKILYEPMVPSYRDIEKSTPNDALKEIEYDYGYLITRGLLVLVSGGILAIVLRGKIKTEPKKP